MIAYRAATHADIPRLAQLCAESIAQPWSECSFSGEFDKGSEICVAVDRDSIIGFAVMELLPDAAYIHLVAVSPAFRRRSIARTLMERMHTVAAEKGICRILLEVRCSNDAAIKLYTTLGYKQLARRRNFYSRPREDGLTMQKEIK